MDVEMSLGELPDGRRAAVLQWLRESVGTCANCGAPVTRTHARQAGQMGFVHVSCVDAKTPLEGRDAAPESAAVVARARRSDWG
jgi:hypothetical protein